MKTTTPLFSIDAPLPGNILPALVHPCNFAFIPAEGAAADAFAGIYSCVHLVQYPAELHIVSLVAFGEAPEWGCDEVWLGGDPVLERCAAVFGIVFKIGEETEPAFLDVAFAEGPLTDGATAPLSVSDFDIESLFPADKSYYTYLGSLVRAL